MKPDSGGVRICSMQFSDLFTNEIAMFKDLLSKDIVYFNNLCRENLIVFSFQLVLAEHLCVGVLCLSASHCSDSLPSDTDCR